MNYTNASAITPSDTASLNGTISAFVVGTNGTVAVLTASGMYVELTCVAGFVYPLRVTKVFNTNTSATGIVGMW